jgi:peroxiredoxin
MAAVAPQREIGWKGVDAILPGTDGNEHQLSDHVGPGGLVVVFMCNHCPYVKAVLPRMTRDARELALHGIGFVGINSNDADAYPDDSFENMQAFSREHRIPFPYLRDETQEIAKAYGALCTPDFFGFNANMRLQYRGRLDTGAVQNAPSHARRELFDAMVKISRSGEGPAEQIPAIGCSLKWKAGNW